MNAIKLLAIIIITGLSACGNNTPKTGTYNDTTTVDKVPADTFNTKANSATNGPDNANGSDNGGNDVNYQKSLSSSGTSNAGNSNKSVNSANNTSGVKNVNNSRHDSASSTR